MRPKDEMGRPLPFAHRRLENAPELEQAAVFAISEDGRLAHLTMKRKLTMARKAIDHVVDSMSAPAWVSKSDPGHPDNHALFEGWRAAVQAIRSRRDAP